ncbi:MAG: aminotransferase class I/II-fold pyridoxal phosphate-dependent enzyme [Armatimonadota bacterium]
MSTSTTHSRIARLPQSLSPSGIRAFFDVVATMPDVITLGVGEPDFPTPWHICDAVLHSLRRGETSYTSNPGTLELRTEIARMLARERGVEYDPGSQVLITVGVSEGLDLALRAILDPGDEVIVPEPCFPAYKACVILAGGHPTIVETKADHQFRLQVADVRAAITPRTKAIIIGYPNNPTGAVMSREDLLPIAQLAREHDLIVISDEIYDCLTYEGAHTCFASLPHMADRTILLNGFSKAYAMTGWRVGYAAGPRDILSAMTKIHSYSIMCAPTLAQAGALEALRNGRNARERMIAEYDQRRRFVVRRLNDMGLQCFWPRGAFYAFPSIEATGLSAEDFSRALLQEQKVAAVPGTAFGQCGEGHVRCTYANSMENLREALARLAAFVEKRAR